MQVLLIGGSTSKMLEALEVVGDGHTIDDQSIPLGKVMWKSSQLSGT